MCKEESANFIPDLLDSAFDGKINIPDNYTINKRYLIISFKLEIFLSSELTVR